MSKTIKFVICDHSTSTDPAQGGQLTPGRLSCIAQALQLQLSGDFSDEWGGIFSVRAGANDASDVAADEVELGIFDHSDQAGAAGYHSTDPKGKAYGRAFREDADSLTSGPRALSVIVSHEGLEIAGDPGANRWADRGDGTEEALEMSDRIEDTVYDVTLQSGEKITMSNFLHQSAFDPGASGPYDRLGILGTQTDQTPGGYAILRQTGPFLAKRADKDKALGMAAKVMVRGLENRSESELKRKKHEGSRTRRRGVTFD
jgi:hypothetical protein